VNKVYHNSFYAMGTRCHLVLPGVDENRADQIFQVVKHEINRVESCLSRFIPYSEISLINTHAAQAPFMVSEEIYNVLKTCLEYHKLTSGGFDITLRPVMQYWQNKSCYGASDLLLYEMLDSTGTRNIVLDEENRTVYLSHDRMEIDLGGFGKGYGLARVHKMFLDFKVENAFLSFGESSILTMGHHPAGDHWKIGLNNYVNPGHNIYMFTQNQGSVSTTSNFYVDDEGVLHSHRHVINPFTGYPVEDFVTVSVQSVCPVVAEILSTAFLVLSDNVIETICLDIAECEVVKVDYTTGHPEIVKFYGSRKTRKVREQWI
jgi:FAD:protein FMN transferase